MNECGKVHDPHLLFRVKTAGDWRYVCLLPSPQTHRYLGVFWSVLALLSHSIVIGIVAGVQQEIPVTLNSSSTNVANNGLWVEQQFLSRPINHYMLSV